MKSSMHTTHSPPRLRLVHAGEAPDEVLDAHDARPREARLRGRHHAQLRPSQQRQGETDIRLVGNMGTIMKVPTLPFSPAAATGGARAHWRLA